MKFSWNSELPDDLHRILPSFIEKSLISRFVDCFQAGGLSKGKVELELIASKLHASGTMQEDFFHESPIVHLAAPF